MGFVPIGTIAEIKPIGRFGAFTPRGPGVKPRNPHPSCRFSDFPQPASSYGVADRCVDPSFDRPRTVLNAEFVRKRTMERISVCEIYGIVRRKFLPLRRRGQVSKPMEFDPGAREQVPS